MPSFEMKRTSPDENVPLEPVLHLVATAMTHIATTEQQGHMALIKSLSQS
jgi:hypothetical protein